MAPMIGSHITLDKPLWVMGITRGPKPVCLTFFILSLFISGVVGDCDMNKCAHDYTMALDENKVLVGSNQPYCILVRQYIDCLRKNSRGCRGDLQYHSLLSLLVTTSNQQDCNNVLAATNIEADKPAPKCLFPYSHKGGASGFRYCGVFGDPHLRTFEGQYETCKTVGAWPLVDNSYLGVQVTNEPVGVGLAATVITKITVIVKSLPGCTSQKTFEATKDYLPSAFNDGTTGSLDHQGGKPPLHIRTIVEDSHVEISLRFISTKVVIRRVGGYLTFAVKIPEEVIDQRSSLGSLELCLSGCGASQRIGYKEVLAYPEYFVRTLGNSAESSDVQPAMPRVEAEELCKAAGVTDFYFDSCVFDLLLTGDRQFPAAAAAAQEDVRTLFPPYRRHFEFNRTSLDLYDSLGQAALSKEASQYRRLSVAEPPSSNASPPLHILSSVWLITLGLLVALSTLR